MPWSVVVTHSWLIICMGMAVEVIFTAATDLAHAEDWKFKGYTYIWMVPIYALIYPFLFYLYPRISSWNLVERGLLYVAIIYGVEYSSGWLLRRLLGYCPWDYGRKKWAVHGLVRLNYAPAWFGASLLYELVFRVLRGWA